MMNFSGENRGFAYAKYGSPAVAAKAIRSLNGYILKLGCSLCVQLSTEKSELCIEGLPAVTEQEQMLKVQLLYSSLHNSFLFLHPIHSFDLLNNLY